MDSSPAADQTLRPISWFLRITSLVAGVLVLLMLIAAARMQPDPKGYGTHQQLGLPPCTSIVLFNAPCPACGMTTSWAWIVRGNFWRAGHANLGGSLLAIIGLAYLPASCYFFAYGKATRRERFSLYLAISLMVAMLAACGQWIYRNF